MAMKLGVPYAVKNTVVEFEPDRQIAWCHFAKARWRYELFRQRRALAWSRPSTVQRARRGRHRGMASRPRTRRGWKGRSSASTSSSPPARSPERRAGIEPAARARRARARSTWSSPRRRRCRPPHRHDGQQQGGEGDDHPPPGVGRPVGRRVDHHGPAAITSSTAMMASIGPLFCSAMS